MNSNFGRNRGRLLYGCSLGLLLQLAACNNPGAASSTSATGSITSSGGGSSSGSGSSSGTTTAAVTQFGSFTPQNGALGSGGTGGSSSGGGAGAMSGPPYGVSKTCGDRIVGLDSAGNQEECDDGDDGSDGCTAACQTRDEAAVVNAAKVDRYLGAGRHPVSGLDGGFVATFVEFPEDEPSVGATLFDIWGKRKQHVTVSDGAFPIEQSNPVAAALPGGAYAVAWTDFGSDGSDLGIALRHVSADGSLGALGSASAEVEFTQQNPDLLWTGTQLVAAWEDFTDATNGPDIKYRLFDANLNPLSDDQALASTAAPEAAVALAPFNGSFAAAYREGAADGSETVVVSAAGKSYRLGPVYGGPPEDRPGLVALDTTHLLLVFSAGTDPGAIGIYNTPRLRYSVIDTASATAPTHQSLDPLDDVYTTDLQVSQLSPALAWGGDGAYLSWRTAARPGDAAADQIWLKYLAWTPTLGTKLGTTERETLLPRVCEASIGDQRTPAIAQVGLPPSGALAFAWDDYSHSQGSKAGDPDVVVHYAPIRLRDAMGPKLVTENWTGTTGAAWPSQWSHFVVSSPQPSSTIQSNQGRVYSPSGAGWDLAGINNHTALDVDMFARVRFNLNSAVGGFFARMNDAGTAMIYARFGTLINDTWRIVGFIDGTEYMIAPGMTTGLRDPGAMFTLYAPQLDYFMRFRITNTATGGIEVWFKMWLSDLQEPLDWTMHGVTNLPILVSKFGSTPGRFGLYAVEGQAGRSTTFDDFRAIFYEGNQHGSLDATPVSTPLLRAPALYRTCASGSCQGASGCCVADSDCAGAAAGVNTCQAAQSQLLGLGSHARACSPKHCGNGKIDTDAGELRVDCGGPDCPPCDPSCLTKARGTSAYCTTACPGGIGDGDCVTSDNCLPGLVCGAERGYKYGWVQGTDVCTPFHCFDRVQDGDELGIDWGGSCGSVQCGSTTNGGYAHCSVSCPCAKGHGDCDYADECQTGLVCGGKGVQFGLVSGNTCVPVHCTNKVKDADETAVDCGGDDCGKICQ